MPTLTRTLSENQYHSEGLKLNNRGQFNAKDIESVFEGQGRLTASIVADVVAHRTIDEA